ncbi:hypothetical protein Q8A67_016032 [Cirrhinus molitorella]|uniref:Uncharacterized protein n=1 Tax=Cirrhinus molitorella TaxID=172907 RepID=A0AA88PNR8_9TELE|nr:hypothetical protein Q8A67_016032 [Cirrhinus molitorella]
MAHKPEIGSCILMCTYLLAMLSGRDALSCCRRHLTRGSSSYELSDPLDPTCNAQWTADGVVVVDESGGVDESRVHQAEPQKITLKGKHEKVIFRMDCVSPEDSGEVDCNGLCQSLSEFSPAPIESHERSQYTQRPKNAAKRSAHDGIFIFLSIVIFIFVT